MLYEAWPFDMTKVTRPVHFWQGTDDKLVPSGVPSAEEATSLLSAMRTKFLLRWLAILPRRQPDTTQLMAHLDGPWH
jgi:hypothetical protein